MLDPRDWNEDYLFTLPVGEFDWLEVKGRRGLDLTVTGVREPDVRENLSKALSAFANSGGGVIVFGLSNPSDAWQIDDGGVNLVVKRPSTREWLEDIIPTLVDSALSTFNVYVIQGSNGSSGIAPGRGIFVIEVPDSEQAPHQASDNRYYARVAGKSRPIGHRLVADIFNRRRDPVIEPKFAIKASTYIDRDLSLMVQRKPPQRKRKVELIIRATNIGKVYARYVNCFIYIPVSLVPEPEFRLHGVELATIDGEKYFRWYEDNTRRDVLKYEGLGPSQYGPSWFDPILPGLAHVWEWELPVDFQMHNVTGERIFWEIYADNAQERKGSVAVRELTFVSEEDTADS